MSVLCEVKGTFPKLHPDMYKYLSEDQIKLNKLLFDLDEAIDLHENGDTHFLCDIHGVCSAVDDKKGKDDGFKSECFFCGADLIVYKGNYYHYSAFHDMEAFKRNYTSYTTHNHFKYTYGTDPVSTEQEKVFEIKKEIDIISHKIKNTKDQNNAKN